MCQYCMANVAVYLVSCIIHVTCLNVWSGSGVAAAVLYGNGSIAFIAP